MLNKGQTARAVANNVLNEFDRGGGFVSGILNKFLPRTSEKQRATDLVLGTIRNRAAIDMVIAKFADCPIERISRKLLTIIRIGAYELIYSLQTGQHAIVNEAVNNAKIIAGAKQGGFVNAILRQITRHIKNREIELSDENRQRTLPQSTSSGCEFDTDILSDFEKAKAEYFSEAFSLPRWLIEEWLGEYGAEKMRQICFASNRRPSIYIRPNKLRITPPELMEKFSDAEIECGTADGEMIKLKSPHAVSELPGFWEGLFSVQDVTASQAVRTLKPRDEWRILDLCAAPGTKTSQLAEMSGDSARIFATDVDSTRLEKIKENVERLGLKSVSVIAYKDLEKIAATEPFDCILLDVPCSNTGVLSKRPEVRMRITPGAVEELTKIQNQILETAGAMLKPRGVICYTTCSIQPAENSTLIKHFLSRHSNFKLESERLILPCADDFDNDGGYVALLAAK